MCYAQKTKTLIENFLIEGSDFEVYSTLHKCFKAENKSGNSQYDDLTQYGEKIAFELKERRLYKRIAIAQNKGEADALYDNYGKQLQRQELESKICKFLKIENNKICIWLPKSKMKLKFADVLVDVNENIKTLTQYDKSSANRFAEIQKSHEDLWNISIYVEPSLAQDRQKKSLILAYLTETLHILWNGLETESVAGCIIESDKQLRALEFEEKQELIQANKLNSITVNNYEELHKHIIELAQQKGFIKPHNNQVLRNEQEEIFTAKGIVLARIQSGKIAFIEDYKKNNKDMSYISKELDTITNQIVNSRFRKRLPKNKSKNDTDFHDLDKIVDLILQELKNRLGEL